MYADKNAQSIEPRRDGEVPRKLVNSGRYSGYIPGKGKAALRFARRAVVRNQEVNPGFDGN